MTIFRQGNMWSCFDEVNHFLITTNAVIKKDGALVMGAGIAKQVRDKWPGIDKEMGAAIKRTCGSGGTYGVILGKKIGLFQVKHHYKDNASLELITYSTNMLKALANSVPERKFALNFPGIGNGKLSYEQVFPIINNLPDNVYVWTY